MRYSRHSNGKYLYPIGKHLFCGLTISTGTAAIILDPFSAFVVGGVGAMAAMLLCRNCSLIVSSKLFNKKGLIK